MKKFACVFLAAAFAAVAAAQTVDFSWNADWILKPVEIAAIPPCSYSGGCRATMKVCTLLYGKPTKNCAVLPFLANNSAGTIYPYVNEYELIIEQTTPPLTSTASPTVDDFDVGQVHFELPAAAFNVTH